MPIVYNVERQGFEVIDPTPEEEKALIDIGMQYVVHRIAYEAAQDVAVDPKKEILH